MDDVYDDIKSLPDDFVENSKPSKVIERLYQRRENAEKTAVDKMDATKCEICDKYKQIMAQRTEELKKKLDDVKGLIKNEIFDSKLKANHENAINFEKSSFTKIYNSIQNYTRRRHELVEDFYTDLVSLEQDKSNEFRKILRETYEQIIKISFKLPNEYDECIEMEIELNEFVYSDCMGLPRDGTTSYIQPTKKINQTILCNQRNYLELKTHLQLEVENDCKYFIEELRHVKEGWIKYLRNKTDKAIGHLKSQCYKTIIQNNPEISKAADEFKNDAEEMKQKIDDVSSVIKIKQAREWLSNIRHTLCKLDHDSQKIIAAFKQAAVLVFNRFFQELKVTADEVSKIIESEEITSIQCDMYTPTLHEIQNSYDVDLEIIQRTWTDLVDQLARTVENTYKFLLAGATLWEKHFKRTEILIVVILKDVDNTIIANNSQSEPYESKLNILIDTLRQEPSKERLHKTLEDIKKLLIGMTELYKSQYQTEIGVYKKYRATQEYKIDILLAEIKRFLVVYPPDLEKDPKLQRKRASWTSEIGDPTEGLIPNQMMFCKYQIGAVANWQFGLWEAITNYAVIAKTEIMAEAEKWVKTQCKRLEKRLEVRLAIHSLRMEKIQSYIFDIRMEELCIHQNRFEEHKIAAEKRTNDLKAECTIYLENFNEIYEKYDEELEILANKCVKLQNSGVVNGQKAVLKAKTEESVAEINQLSNEYVQKCNYFFEKVKISNIKFAENMRMFIEGGNFTIQETKDYLKFQSKIEAQSEKILVGVKKEIDIGKGKIIAKVEARDEEVGNIIELIRLEHKFKENINKKILTMKYELRKEVCLFHRDFNKVVDEFNGSKMEIITNCGNYEYINSFGEYLKESVQQIEKLGKYLYHPTPIVLFSGKDEFISARLPTMCFSCYIVTQMKHTKIGNTHKKLIDFYGLLIYKDIAEGGIQEVMFILENFKTNHRRHRHFFLFGTILK